MSNKHVAHQVYIECPNTGHVVYPGIRGSKSLLSKRGYLAASVLCSACGQVHELSDKTVRIAPIR